MKQEAGPYETPAPEPGLPLPRARKVIAVLLAIVFAPVILWCFMFSMILGVIGSSLGSAVVSLYTGKSFFSEWGSWMYDWGDWPSD